MTVIKKRPRHKDFYYFARFPKGFDGEYMQLYKNRSRYRVAEGNYNTVRMDNLPEWLINDIRLLDVNPNIPFIGEYDYRLETYILYPYRNRSGLS